MFLTTTQQLTRTESGERVGYQWDSDGKKKWYQWDSDGKKKESDKDIERYSCLPDVCVLLWHPHLTKQENSSRLTVSIFVCIQPVKLQHILPIFLNNRERRGLGQVIQYRRGRSFQSFPHCFPPTAWDSCFWAKLEHHSVHKYTTPTPTHTHSWNRPLKKNYMTSKLEHRISLLLLT